MYQYSYSHNGTLHGFVNHTLSFFNVSQLKEGTQPENSQFDQEVQFCRFKDYREPPWAPNPYEFSKQYWSVLSARLAFVIIFQNLVMFLSVLVDWMIPDIPTDISDQIKKEKSLLVDFFLKEEHEKVKLADEPAQRSHGGGDRSLMEPCSQLCTIRLEPARQYSILRVSAHQRMSRWQQRSACYGETHVYTICSYKTVAPLLLGTGLSVSPKESYRKGNRVTVQEGREPYSF